jgi:hypothetical protein
VTNLNNYLAGLSPGWSDTTQDTTIIPATWRTNWDNAYQRRQQLLNKIADEAGKRAHWPNVAGPGLPENDATKGATLGLGAAGNVAGQISPATLAQYVQTNTIHEGGSVTITSDIPAGQNTPSVQVNSSGICLVLFTGGLYLNQQQVGDSYELGSGYINLIVNGSVVNYSSGSAVSSTILYTGTVTAHAVAIATNSIGCGLTARSTVSIISLKG